MNGACNINIFFGPTPWGPREGSKGQISFNFNYKVNFKDFFIPNFVWILINKRYKYIRQDFHSVPWVMPQGWDLGALGVPRMSFFFKHGHVVYQIEGDDEQNRMQVK